MIHFQSQKNKDKIRLVPCFVKAAKSSAADGESASLSSSLSFKVQVNPIRYLIVFHLPFVLDEIEPGPNRF